MNQSRQRELFRDENVAMRIGTERKWSRTNSRLVIMDTRVRDALQKVTGK